MTNCPACEQRDRDAYYTEHFIPELKWPEGRLAVSIVFNIQGNEAAKAGPNGRVDYETYTEQEYGLTTGIWRVLRSLEQRGVKSTFMVCGFVAERFPDVVLGIRDGGHEIAGHGYHHEVATDIPASEERQIMTSSRDILRSVAGVDITGWRSCHQSPNTPELVMDMGFKYNTNSFKYDLPYLIEREGRTIVEVPRQPFGDMRTFGRSGFGGDPEVAYQIWRTSFDTFYEESEAAPAYCPYSLHPFIIGRPGRIDALNRLIDHIQARPGVWLATSDQVADAALVSAGHQHATV